MHVLTPTPSGAAPTDEDVNSRKVYRCGTLTYTKVGLFMMFAWLLWGDFCFTQWSRVSCR